MNFNWSRIKKLKLNPHFLPETEKSVSCAAAQQILKTQFKMLFSFKKHHFI